MKTYFTKNSEYPVEKIEDFEIIRSLQHPTKGKPYMVLGSIDSNKHKLIWRYYGKYHIPLVDGEVLIKDNYKKFVEKDVREESRIVSILMDESNTTPSWGEPFDLMITSSVRRIVND